MLISLIVKIYRKIIEQVIENIPNLDEWHSPHILKLLSDKGWKECIVSLHDPNKNKDINSKLYKRLAYDEILANLIVLSKIRSRIKRIKKRPKVFNNSLSKYLVSNFNFILTNNQKEIINEINKDMKSENKMFRLLQGDVGSGKTIISLISASNVIESNYQTAFMAPTEILAKQHYNLAKKVFAGTKIKIGFLIGKTKSPYKKKIIQDLSNGKIKLLVGTHALFQKDIRFNNLGLVIIDEQHKFGVKQRMELANKGGDNCDILIMSATPIPRTLILAFYGDMDISKLIEKRLKPLDIDLESDNALDTWIKNNIGTGHHVSCTAKMGPYSDPMAVVDQYGKLHGADGIRVADASIMPDCVRANINVTVMMIGERISGFITSGY